MAEEDKEVGAQEEASEKASSQKSPLVALLLIINTVGLATVAFFQYQFMQMEAARPDLNELLKQASASSSSEDGLPEDRPVEKISRESLVNLETFTVNLAQGDGPRRYVRLNAVLKLSPDSEVAEVEARKPQIRDTIIGILNSKRPEDILKRDGKLYLKEQIKSAINSFLIDGKVEDLFYVGFQIN